VDSFGFQANTGALGSAECKSEPLCLTIRKSQNRFHSSGHYWREKRGIWRLLGMALPEDGPKAISERCSLPPATRGLSSAKKSSFCQPISLLARQRLCVAAPSIVTYETAHHREHGKPQSLGVGIGKLCGQGCLLQQLEQVVRYHLQPQPCGIGPMPGAEEYACRQVAHQNVMHPAL
jgi:hypothetical protein